MTIHTHLHHLSGLHIEREDKMPTYVVRYFPSDTVVYWGSAALGEGGGHHVTYLEISMNDVFLMTVLHC